MLKRIILRTANGLIILAAFLYIVLNDPRVFSAVVKFCVNKSFKQFQVGSIKIRSQKFSLPGKLLFDGVDLVFDLEKTKHAISLDKLGVEVKSFSEFNFNVQNASYQLDKLSVAGIGAWAGLKINEQKEWSMDGTLKAERSIFDGYELSNIESFIAGNSGAIRLNKIRANLYGGRIEGDILLEYQPELLYSIFMNFSEVDSRLLKKINPDVFSQLEGILNGLVRLKGSPMQLRYLKGAFNIPDGGKLKASLLGFVAQYIPLSKEKEQLDLLIKTNGMVDVELASVNLESLDHNQLKGEVNLSSRQLNLQINVPMDIKFDGELSSVFQNWEKVLKQQ